MLYMSCWSAGEANPNEWRWYIFYYGSPYYVSLHYISPMFKIQFSEGTPDHWQITTDRTTQIGVAEKLKKFFMYLFRASSVCVVYKPKDAERFEKEGERIKEYVKLVKAATIKIPGKAEVHQIVGTSSSQKDIYLKEW